MTNAVVRPVAVDVVRLLLDTYLFGDLTPAVVQPLADRARIRRYQRGEYVFHTGDRATALFIVAEGQLHEPVTSPSGGEVVFEVYTRAGVFGEPALFVPERTRIVDAVATTPATIVALDRPVLVEFLLRHPPVILRMLESLASQTRVSILDATTQAHRPIRDRLVLKLLELAQTHGRPSPHGTVIQLQLTQSDLAALIGASRENVNRALAGLTRAGLIITHTGTITITQPHALTAMVTPDQTLHRRNRLKPPSHSTQ
jgi:CRP/FNR family transcriptional regulator, cyclic AMP receptor protein